MIVVEITEVVTYRVEVADCWEDPEEMALIKFNSIIDPCAVFDYEIHEQCTEIVK